MADMATEPTIKRRNGRGRTPVGGRTLVVGGIVLAAALASLGAGAFLLTRGPSHTPSRAALTGASDPSDPSDSSAPRPFDRAAFEEMDREFDANPVAAARKYAGTRWRFEARVRAASAPDRVTVSVGDDRWGLQEVRLRMAGGGVLAVRAGEVRTFEGTFEGFDFPVVRFADVVTGSR